MKRAVIVALVCLGMCGLASLYRPRLAYAQPVTIGWRPPVGCSANQDITWNGTTWTCGAADVTNSAGANVIPKSDGTNLVASSISDNGTTIAVGDSAAKFHSLRGNWIGGDDDTRFAWDGSARIGFTKKAGFFSKLTYGSATDFAIAQSSGASIDATNTFTDKITISAAGAIGLVGNTAVTGTLSTTGNADLDVLTIGQTGHQNVDTSLEALSIDDTGTLQGNDTTARSRFGVDVRLVPTRSVGEVAYGAVNLYGGRVVVDSTDVLGSSTKTVYGLDVTSTGNGVDGYGIRVATSGSTNNYAIDTTATGGTPVALKATATYRALWAEGPSHLNGTVTIPAGGLSVANGVTVTSGSVTLGSGGPRIQTGTGTPESVVTAPVGSLYLRSDGGASTTLYVKESGTGNTGWVAK